MDMAERLDPLNPPKYCPTCKKNGVNSKVKKYKVQEGGENKRIIMCKNDQVSNEAMCIDYTSTLFLCFQCPWPFNVAKKEDATVNVDVVINAAGKKRKKEKVGGQQLLGDITNAETEEVAATLSPLQDKCKSPNNKKLKLNTSEGNGRLSSKIRDKEADIINYIQQQSVSLSAAPPAQQPEQQKVLDGVEAESDSEVFTAVPVAVRQPIRLPRHAANLLGSRSQQQKQVEKEAEQEEEEEEEGGEESDLECFASDTSLGGSDSELESLVSECSTMSAVSENSSSCGGGLVGGGEAGAGKRKRRGKKKKRKEKRKAHEGKCSKEQPRMSDLAVLAQPNRQEVQEREEVGKKETVVVVRSQEPEHALPPPTKVDLSSDISSDEYVQIPPPAPPPAPPARAVLLPAPTLDSRSASLPMSVSPTVSDMSVGCSRQSTRPAMSVSSAEPRSALSESDQEMPEPLANNPSGDTEQSSKMSNQSALAKESVYTPGLKLPAVSPPTPAPASPVAERAEVPAAEHVHVDEPAETGAAVSDMSLFSPPRERRPEPFKSPLTKTKSSPRPVSHPSNTDSAPDLSPKYLSLPNLLSPMPATPKSVYDDQDSGGQDGETGKDIRSNSAGKSKTLESVISSINKSYEDRWRRPSEKAAPALPDGPYPRRRGRKAAARRFGQETSSEEERDPAPAPAPAMRPPDTPPKRGRGRPPKNKPVVISSAGSSGEEGEVGRAGRAAAILEQVPNLSVGSKVVNIVSQTAPVPPTPPPVAKVIRLVNGKSLPRGVVPCAPPPGAKLVPTAPPSDAKLVPSPSPAPAPPAAKKSVFDVDETEDLLSRVQRNLEDQNAADAVLDVAVVPPDEKADMKELTAIKPVRTFSRKPKPDLAVTALPSLSNKAAANHRMFLNHLKLIRGISGLSVHCHWPGHV